VTSGPYNAPVGGGIDTSVGGITLSDRALEVNALEPPIGAVTPCQIDARYPHG
jgi:hypothetical protein